MEWICFIISFIASVIGGICGIGGGIIIKPAFDLAGLYDASTVSFLSGCTVLSMSAYNVCKSLAERTAAIDRRSSTPLALGAAAGGVFGNRLFGFLKLKLGNGPAVGTAQALCLLVLTLGTLIYTVNKKRIHTRSMESMPACAAIGLALGVLSSFLGIGGGPFNLVVLHYFFGMDSKKAVSNSLYIILFSQAANIAAALLRHTVPEFAASSLVLMILGGISGGVLGKAISSRLNNATVDRLFIALQTGIIVICAYNAASY